MSATESVADLLGPWSVALPVSALLTGISVVQCYDYYRGFPHDSGWMKTLVGAIFSLNFVATGFDCSIIWHMSVTDFGNHKAIVKLPVARIITLFFSSFITLMVQCYFAHRSWKAVNRNWILLGVMAVTILAAWAGMFTTAAMQSRDNALSRISNKQIPTLIWLWGSAVADWTITTILILKIQLTRSDDLPATVEALVQRTLRLVLSTAALTSVVATLDAVVYIVSSTKDNAHMAFSLTLVRVYVISFFYSVNSRAHIRNFMDATQSRSRSSNFCERCSTVGSWNPRLKEHPDFPGRMIMVTQSQSISVQNVRDGPLSETDSVSFSANGTPRLGSGAPPRVHYYEDAVPSRPGRKSDMENRITLKEEEEPPDFTTTMSITSRDGNQ